MQYCSFVLKGGDPTIRPGRLLDDDVEELDASSLIEVIDRKGGAESKAFHKIVDIKLAAPIQSPSKIICIGLNYRDHIKEFGHEIPSEPVLFSKPSTSIIGPGDPIILPKASEHIDYEGEIAIVIGNTAKKIGQIEDCIFGYTCFNDVTARDIQRRSPDWTRAKGFDSFAPMGPIIETDRPAWVKTYLNYEQVQFSKTNNMIFGFEELVANISQVMTLNPGDIIATGTPSGVGKLKPGDRIVIEGDGIGKLENTVSEEQ